MIAAATRHLTLLILCGLIILSVAAGSLGSLLLERTITLFLIHLILVVGLYTFVGISGVVSFGHMAFMGIGAYASVLLTIEPSRKAAILPDLPAWLIDVHVAFPVAVLVAAAVGAIFAAAIGYPLMRLSGVPAAIATLSCLVIVKVVLENWEAVTRGTRTMFGVPRLTSLSVAAVWALLVLVVAYAFSRSSIGLRLRASREDPAAAAAAGIGVAGLRWLAFVISAATVSVGGVLWGHYIGSFSPNSFYLAPTFLTIVMLIVGGVGSLSGAVVGTVAITALTEVLRTFEGGVVFSGYIIEFPLGVAEMILGACLLFALIVRPEGLMGGRELGARPLGVPDPVRPHEGTRSAVDGAAEGQVQAGAAETARHDGIAKGGTP